MKKVQILFALLLLVVALNAQYSYSTAGSVYSQNFDGLPSSGTSSDFSITGSGPFDLSASPFNASNLTGWQFYKTGGTGSDAAFLPGTGTNNNGDVYSFGNVGASNRALGSLPTSGNTYSFGLVITNNTGATLNSFTIGFTAEQWRNGGSNIANTWTFKYKIGSALTSINQASLITISNLSFSSVITSSVSSALDGSLAANQMAKSFTLTGITWNIGDQLIIRWDDAAHTKSDAMAIDNFSFAAYPSSLNMYQWKGGASGAYTTATNWNPSRTAVSPKDMLLFNTAGAIAVDNVSAETISNIIVSNSAALTLKNTVSTSGLNISGNLNICSGASLTAGANLTINTGSAGSLNVNGTLNTNNAVILKSDNTSTASLGVCSGTIIGNISVERFIPAQRAYRLLGHPFSNSIALSALLPYIDITGQSGGGFANGYGNNPSAYSYNTSNDTWQAFTSAAGLWNPGQGLLLFIRGKSGEGLSGANNAAENYISGGPSDLDLSVSGNINSGDITYKTGSTNTWNLIGNPYAAPIDITQVNNLITTAGGTGASIYVWDPNAQKTFKAALSGAYIAKQLNAPIIIPIYGAFFLRNTTGSAQVLTFSESTKNLNTAPLTVFDNRSEQSITLSIEKNNTCWDQLIIHFKNNASDSAIDQQDLEKFYNSNLNFYSVSIDKKKLAVDTRACRIKGNNVIPLGLTTSVNSVYTLKAVGVELLPNITALLYDRYTNRKLIIDNDLKYDFEITDDTASQGNSRFEIITREVEMAVPVTNSVNEQLNVYPNPVTDYLIVTLAQQDAKPVNINVFNSVGQNVKSIRYEQYSGSIKIPVKDLTEGIYVVELNMGNKILTQKIIKK